jgi:8-oxo-dGTP pyrophosphatase MutT (NUDIX family)
LNDVPVRDGATVALLRDTSPGFEVFMLKRSSAAVFSPNAHVFPGGAVDDDDHAGASDLWCASLPAPPAIPVGFYVAALREAFEEAGLLLARRPDGGLVEFDEPEAAERFALHRKAINAGDASIADVCEREGLTLAIDHLVLFGHWITPPGAPRRFDTRFFAARAPERQLASPDGHETTSGLWTRPADMLAANDAGDVELILPTRHSLELLASFADVDDALEGLAAEA